MENEDIFTECEIHELESLNQKFSPFMLEDNESLKEKLSFDFIYTSAKIEGNTYTIAEAKTLLETKLPVSTKKIDDGIMLLNIQAAFNYVFDFKPEISKQTIKELHQILSQGLLKNPANVGNFRQNPIYISGTDYIPLANFYELENELDKLLVKFHDIKNPYTKALFLHNNIAYLQCFEDCNKRLSRMLQNLSLIKNDKLFLSYNANNADIVASYIDAVLQYYNTGSYEKSRAFFINEYKKTFMFL